MTKFRRALAYTLTALSLAHLSRLHRALPGTRCNIDTGSKDAGGVDRMSTPPQRPSDAAAPTPAYLDARKEGR